jgi:hypothetical protein
VSDEDVSSGADDDTPGLPFPDSLCHRCAAPPRYIKTNRSTFIYCPLFKRYPPQPVRECEKFQPKASPDRE